MGLFWDRRKDERRSGKDRRDKPSRGEQPERRLAERRVGKRRIWPYGVLYKTTESAAGIEEWLEKNRRGKWAMRLADLDDMLVEKSFKVMFEFETDKSNFIKYFSR